MDPRHWLLTTLFAVSQGPWAWLKRREPWDVTPLQLAQMPPGSLGHALGLYLMDLGFELMPKLESHDVFHLLTGVRTDVPGEIELQFVLFGNGKRSLYLLGVLGMGLVLFPEYGVRWREAAARGASLEPFFAVDYRAQLSEPLERVVPVPREVDVRLAS